MAGAHGVRLIGGPRAGKRRTLSALDFPLLCGAGGNEGLQGRGEKGLPLFSSVIEFLGKVVFVLVFIPRFAYDAVILCEPVVWCFMALYLVAVYRCNPFVFPKKQ